MTPKERILSVLNRQPVDRLPVDLWHTPEVSQQLINHTGAADEFEMWRILGLDKIVWDFMEYKTDGGLSQSQVAAGAGGQGEARSMWGVPLKTISAGSATYQEFGVPPLSEYETPESIEAYPFWPNPERFDYEGAVERARRASKDFCVIGPWISFFEVYCMMRGIEQSMMDLALDPEYVETVLDRIESIQTTMLHRFLPQVKGHLDLVFISDDIGGQNGMMFSPDVWRTHLKPRMQRWCELIHGYGMKVFYHSDGGFLPVMTELLDTGIDVLNPIQHVCPGMDCADLKKRFGSRVVFHGGIDNQHVLPFGTTAEVKAETKMCLDTLGSDKQGYICCSCHNVQSGTPIENILTMIETVKSS